MDHVSISPESYDAISEDFYECVQTFWEVNSSKSTVYPVSIWSIE